MSGASILVHQGARLVVATAADADGRFSILFTPGQTFTVSAEMAAFQSQQKELTLGALPCDSKLDFDLPLVPRDRAAAEAAAAGTAGATTAPTGRFTQLTVRSDPAGAATLDVTPPDQSAELARLLPPGFTLQSASADAVSVSARGDAINVDRGILNDRMSAIGRGEFDPATGQFATGFTPLSPEEAFGQNAAAEADSTRAAAAADRAGQAVLRSAAAAGAARACIKDRPTTHSAGRGLTRPTSSRATAS